MCACGLDYWVVLIYFEIQCADFVLSPSFSVQIYPCITVRFYEICSSDFWGFECREEDFHCLFGLLPSLWRPDHQTPCTASSGYCLFSLSQSPSTQHCGSVTRCSWASTYWVSCWSGNLAQSVPWSSWPPCSLFAIAAGGTASCITAPAPSCRTPLMIPA